MEPALEHTIGAMMPPFLPTYSPTKLNVSHDSFLHSLADEIEAKGMERPCISRDEILAAIDEDRDTTFLIKTSDLENMVLTFLTEEGIKNLASSLDDVMNIIKSDSSCFAHEYLLVNTETYEDALFGAMMEDRHNDEDNESVSIDEVLAFLRER